MAQELARELINSGVHFGHSVSRWNPKMQPYIFAKRGIIHIIDVKETLKGILVAKKLLSEVVAGGADVVFVGTKRQAKKAIEKTAQSTGMHFVSSRWLGGMLTNFNTIRSRVSRLEELEGMIADGSIESESKKRASTLKREYRKIKSNLDGVRKMNRMPGAVVVVDAKKEHLALAEAKKLGIYTIGLIDTDSDPDAVDVAIPANDDSMKGIELILNELAAAVAEGKTRVIAKEEKPAAAAKRSRRRSLARASESGEQPAAEETQPDTSAEPAEVKTSQEQAASEKAVEQPAETAVNSEDSSEKSEE